MVVDSGGGGRGVVKSGVEDMIVLPGFSYLKGFPNIWRWRFVFYDSR